MEGLSVTGRVIYPGYELKMCVQAFSPDDPNRGLGARYRCILLAGGTGSIQINDRLMPVTAPAVLCLNERDEAFIHFDQSLSGRCLFFDTTVINKQMTFQNIREPDPTALSSGSLDFWCIRPFMERDKTYHGLIAIDATVSRRVNDLLNMMDALLKEQPDDGWPCRSRSYLIELLFVLGRIYDCPRTDTLPGVSDAEEFLRPVVLYLSRNFNRKVRLDDLTREFHINKTTLNEKFKKATGVSIMAYLNSLRMQIACSILQNTTMPVSLIMQRVGFVDDAHFLRAFKKYAGLTPSEYRSMHCWMLKRDIG